MAPAPAIAILYMIRHSLIIFYFTSDISQFIIKKTFINLRIKVSIIEPKSSNQSIMITLFIFDGQDERAFLCLSYFQIIVRTQVDEGQLGFQYVLLVLCEFYYSSVNIFE